MNYQETSIPFTTKDGISSNLIRCRGEDISQGPVILVHGAGVRANIFRAPTQGTIVDFLVEKGYDVWLENWRASIDLEPNEWDLDLAAMYDHPAAVEKVVEVTQVGKIKAIIHCQGSTSFMLALISGLLPNITTVVSNAVSLHPVVPTIAKYKSLLTPVLQQVTDYLNPQWALDPPNLFAKSLNTLIQLTHFEDENSVSKFASFTYGFGFPVLWSHDNINSETMDWLQHEFGFVPLTFFEQIQKSIFSGKLVTTGKFQELPPNALAHRPKTQARCIFVTGEENQCFTPESQLRTYQYFEELAPGKHQYHCFPNYGHLDIFMGKNAKYDVFPILEYYLQDQQASDLSEQPTSAPEAQLVSNS